MKNHNSNSFKLLWQAIKDSRKPMWASIQVLIVLTFILATIFFIAESEAQPEEYNFGKSLLWGFTRYIGDPGKFAGSGPITLTGRIVASLIGIVGILIFAVPAGLISSGFRGAIDKEIRKKHLIDIGERIKKAFRRRQDVPTKYMVVPRYISIGTLKASRQLSEQDIVDAVRHNPEYRLRNLAIAAKRGDHAFDQIVVEMFYKNTTYGSCINRNSNITICCPTANSEAGVGNFSYYLALMGGFNYISKEVADNIDEANSYYNLDPDRSKWKGEKGKFFDDLKNLVGTGNNKWVIFIIESLNSEGYGLQFLTETNDKAGVTSTIIDLSAFQNLYHELETVLKEQFEMKITLNKLKSAGPKNIGVRIGGGNDVNAFTMRVWSEFSVWDFRNIEVAKTISSILNKDIGNPDFQIPEKNLKKGGIEYQL